MRSIPLGERDRWCQGLAGSMRAGGEVVDRGLKSTEKEMSLCADFGVGSRGAAVDEQCLSVANVADAEDQGLAGLEEDDASSVEQTN